MKQEPRSPFFIVPEFISPMACEDIVDMLNFTVPDTDKDGNDVLTTKTSELIEQQLYERFAQIIPTLEQYYGIEYKGMEPMAFEWYPQGSKREPYAENSNFLRGKWLRTKQRDLTAVLFFSDHQDSPDFEQEFEVYGGKLEFPQHHFGINPIRGTLVVFPSDPHFINLTSQVYAGELFQAKIQLAAKNMYLYDPKQFPGNYTVWF